MPLQVTDWSPHDELNPVGNVTLLVVDIQGGGAAPHVSTLGGMTGQQARRQRAIDLVNAFRAKGRPVVFLQEVHKPSLIDIGRELDGAEGAHCVEGWETTELYPGLEPLPHEYLVQKRRYSGFYGTELDIVLKGYGTDTIVMIGGLTDVCIHYTAVDAHQLDYRFRTISDLVGGSSDKAHDAALRAMRYLQRDSLVTADAAHAWLDSLTDAPMPGADAMDLER
ncbi:cysteine hydrolase family protein [Demequina gelatinilytica]|uniref:cysteine hydrolase family protein n=1 Tax=Demequina gelatinilytica TaxID=1638980 RepID=UPI00078264FF|nr:isochorismatase family cysteine hydrolase [Demequina gelatinilytica]